MWASSPTIIFDNVCFLSFTQIVMKYVMELFAGISIVFRQEQAPALQYTILIIYEFANCRGRCPHRPVCEKSAFSLPCTKGACAISVLKIK